MAVLVRALEPRLVLGRSELGIRLWNSALHVTVTNRSATQTLNLTSEICAWYTMLSSCILLQVPPGSDAGVTWAGQKRFAQEQQNRVPPRSGSKRAQSKASTIKDHVPSARGICVLRWPVRALDLGHVFRGYFLDACAAC